MLESLEWPSLEARRAQARVIMLHKIINNLVDTDTNQYLEPAVIRDEEAVRFITPYARTSVYKYSFFPAAVRLWYCGVVLLLIRLLARPAIRSWFFEDERLIHTNPKRQYRISDTVKERLLP